MRTLVAVADDLPTGRWRRAAKVGRLAGGQTARGYATKAANLTRSEQGRQDAAARRQMEAAEQIFEVLGQMKGAAMKVGQVASFIDTGAFPPEFQERIQAKLAELRDAAPRVAFKSMRKVIEDDLGERLGDAVRRVRRPGRGGRLDRSGLPRPAARRPRGGGQGAVPRASRRRCAPTSRTWA